MSGFTWPHFPPGFAGLARIIAGQQLSTRAAATIWDRVLTACGEPEPESYLALPEDALRAAGLSRQKIGYIRGLAEAVLSGALRPQDFAAMDDAGVEAAITALKGFGPWSAQMALMFGLARPDVWPAGDLGIQTGMQRYLGLAARPGFEETRGHGDRFAPRRTAASLLLWSLKDAGK